MDHTARVYRNLNNGQWSIQQRRDGRWIVVGYAEHIDMVNPVTRQSIAGRDRARRNGVRNVHCMVQGTLNHVRRFTSLKGRDYSSAGYAEPAICHKPITYNPFIHATLQYCDTGRDYVGSSAATFTKQQVMLVNQ